MMSENDSRPTTPLPISPLNSLMPITILLNSKSWASFSCASYEKNDLNPALGRTDSRASATSLSMELEIEDVKLIVE